MRKMRLPGFLSLKEEMCDEHCQMREEEKNIFPAVFSIELLTQRGMLWS